MRPVAWGSAITINRRKFMAEEIFFCLKADEAPSLPGAYAIAIEFANTLAVTLSGRSPIGLPAGRYLYSGSAKGPGCACRKSDSAILAMKTSQQRL
jgi:hypothetical protein